MPEGQKEAETAQTFDADAYKSNLIDNEDYSEETAAVKAKKKKEQLEAQAEKGPVVKMIEINLDDIMLNKVQHEKMVTVHRGGKTFQRRQKVGKKDVKPEQLMIGFAGIMSEAPKYGSRREFMAAVNKAWKTGEMIEVEDERGVAFGDTLLTADVLEAVQSSHPRSKLLTYSKKPTAKKVPVKKKPAKKKVAKKEPAKEKKETLYIPKMSDIGFDLYADDVKTAIDNSKSDTLDNIDEYTIHYYIEEQTPEEYSLRHGTEDLRDEFQKKLYDTFKAKYMKGK